MIQINKGMGKISSKLLLLINRITRQSIKFLGIHININALVNASHVKIRKIIVLNVKKVQYKQEIVAKKVAKQVIILINKMKNVLNVKINIALYVGKMDAYNVQINLK